MAAKVEDLIRTGDQMIADRAIWEADWRLLGQYLLNRRSRQIRNMPQGTKLTDGVFDTAGAYAAQILASSLQGNLTPFAQAWFALTMEIDALNAVDSIQDYLEEIRNIYLKHLSRSNFNSESAEAYLDQCVFGTSCVFRGTEEPSSPGQFSGFLFVAQPIGSYCIAEGPNGRVDTVYRSFEMSASAAVRKWGKDNVGEAIAKAHEEKPYQNVEIYHAVYPRENLLSSKRDNKNFPFASCYYSKAGTKIISEGGYKRFPFLVTRLRKVSGEVWGRGYGHDALPEVRSLNRAVEMWLETGAKAIDPPTQEVEDSVKGDLDLTPAARNVVEHIGDIEPIKSGIEWQAVQFMFDRFERKIREVFHVDEIKVLGSPEKNSYMTAYEAALRKETSLVLLGPVYGQETSEWLQPLVEGGIMDLDEADVLPDPPQEMTPPPGQDSPEVSIRYEGALAKAQQSSTLIAMQRKLEFFASVVAYRPEVIDTWNWDEASRHFDEVAGVPAKVTMGKDAIEEIRKRRAEEQAAQKQTAEALATAQAAGQAAPMVKALTAVPGGGGA